MYKQIHRQCLDNESETLLVIEPHDPLSVVPSATPLSESTVETASPPAALVLINQGSHGMEGTSVEPNWSNPPFGSGNKLVVVYANATSRLRV